MALLLCTGYPEYWRQHIVLPGDILIYNIHILFLVFDEMGTDGDHICGLVVGVPDYRFLTLPDFAEKHWVWNGVYSAS
jgi:hypothetical protein